MSDVTNYIQSKLDAAIKVAHDQLPTVTKAVLDVTRYDCLGQVAWASFWLVFGLIFLVFSYRHYLKSDSFYKEGRSALCVVFCIIGTIATLGGLIALINPWNWVCIYHPDLYLIHLGINKLTSH